MNNPLYLGDGVYVSQTKYGMAITTGHHDPLQADNVVHLEPEVIQALIRYITKYYNKLNESTNYEDRD